MEVIWIRIQDFLKEFFLQLCGLWKIQLILLTTQEVVDKVYDIFEGWDVSLATKHSIWVLSRITVRIQEFLLVRDKANIVRFFAQLRKMTTVHRE